MSTDARFEDAGEEPLRLIAHEGADLEVISTLVQDAVLSAGDLTFDRRRRRFGLLLNRFRWEDQAAAKAEGRPFERVRSLMVIEDVLEVRTLGITPANRDLVLSLLRVEFLPGTDGVGRLSLIFAGDGAIQMTLEALDVTLTDVTRPYVAPSHHAPEHKDGAAG